MPAAVDGMSWKVSRSAIHGLGSWLAEKASMRVRLFASLSRWYSYSHEVDPASVTGVQKLKPWGTAVAGKLLPREKLPLDCVPRVVTTWSLGRPTTTGGASRTTRSSTQPPKSAGPAGLS